MSIFCSFEKLLLQLNPSVIKSYPEDRDVRLMVFDEQFLVRYGGRKDVSLIVYTDKNQAKVILYQLKEVFILQLFQSSDARFHLSDTNWSIIAQYKQLFMRTLIVDTKWLLELMLVSWKSACTKNELFFKYYL